MAATDFQWARNPMANNGDLPVKNFSGTAIPAGAALKFDTGNPLAAGQGAFAVVPCTATTDDCDGIAVDNIPANGGQGRMQVHGIAVCFALGAIAAGALVGPSATSGAVTTKGAGGPQIGKALSAAANANDPIVVKLDFAHDA